MVWYTMWCHRWDHIAPPMILNRCSFETCALPLYITSSSLFWALLSSAPSSRQDLERKKTFLLPALSLSELGEMSSKWLKIPDSVLSPSPQMHSCGRKKVLYEPSSILTKKWKRFSENWNIEVPFTFIFCQLQTVPSTDSETLNCVSFIFYYNCIQVLKERQVP